jgi:hypothetical protein
LSLLIADVDHTADFGIQPDFENPTVVPAGAAVTLLFRLTPTTRAPAGHVTLRASLFAFDTAFGRNLLASASFEPTVSRGVPFPWFFASDSPQLAPDAEGVLVTGPALTGLTAGKVSVPATKPGFTRFYCDNEARIRPGRLYLLSGYVKTENVISQARNGAAVYVPVTGTPAYQEPGAPWIVGTRDWRKALVAFWTGSAGVDVVAHCRGQIQQGTGTAWFDNFALTEGPVDASLTVTSPEQSLEVTGG